MSETAEKIIYVTTNGPESPEATLPFKLANAGLALDLDVMLALQGGACCLSGHAGHDSPSP